MTGITLPAAAALAWLLTPLLSAGLVGRSDRLRAAIGRHLRLCLTVGWLGVTGLMWGATSLDTGPGLAAFLLGGPLGGLSVWSRTAGGEGRGDDPPEWDWDRFGRDLGEYEAGRLPGPVVRAPSSPPTPVGSVKP